MELGINIIIFSPFFLAKSKREVKHYNKKCLILEDVKEILKIKILWKREKLDRWKGFGWIIKMDGGIYELEKCKK